MIGWIREHWRRFARRRRQTVETDVRSFRDLARELRELAAIAARVWPDEPEFQGRIRKIRAEMDQLDDLTTRPEFSRLPLKKRVELRESLLVSKTRLMDTVSTAPPPTMRPQ